MGLASTACSGAGTAPICCIRLIMSSSCSTAAVIREAARLRFEPILTDPKLDVRTLLRLCCRQTVVERVGRKTNPLNLLTFHLQIKATQRADERTRTADLLITSEQLGVAGRCTGLQIPHRYAVLSSADCCELHHIALPVVSKWCQLVPKLKT